MSDGQVTRPGPVAYNGRIRRSALRSCRFCGNPQRFAETRSPEHGVGDSAMGLGMLQEQEQGEGAEGGGAGREQGEGENVRSSAQGTPFPIDVTPCGVCSCAADLRGSISLQPQCSSNVGAGGWGWGRACEGVGDPRAWRPGLSTFPFRIFCPLWVLGLCRALGCVVIALVESAGALSVVVKVVTVLVVS